MAPDLLNATLIERIDLNPSLAIFRLRFMNGHTPDFEPGQYTTLGLPPNPSNLQAPETDKASPGRRRRAAKLIRRAYSIASSPLAKDYIEFYLVVVDEGALTPDFWRLREGDPVFVGEKIRGNFTLDGIPPDKNLIMVATGTGLAPYLSMYHTYRGTGRWGKFVIIEGCRHVQDLGYFDYLNRIAAQDESLLYFPTVTREPHDAPWDGLRGRVQTILEDDRFTQLVGSPLTPQRCHVFLCGNPDMIDQCEVNLRRRGFVTKDRQHPDGNIHHERYW